MKKVVIYESKYGTTKKYAQWIAEALACNLYEKKSVTSEKLKEYDIIVYGGGLYASGVSGINLMTKNFSLISEKHIILFTCGLADPNDPENVEHIRGSLAKVLSPEMQERFKIFHLRGGIDYSKLGLIHKSMMAMLRKMTEKKDYDTLRNEDKEMLETYGKVVDFTDQTSIQPIIDYVTGL